MGVCVSAGGQSMEEKRRGQRGGKVGRWRRRRGRGGGGVGSNEGRSNGERVDKGGGGRGREVSDDCFMNFIITKGISSPTIRTSHSNQYPVDTY